ncbi:MAG TPA: hypothetical protein DHW15_13685 [Bacteroidetes bacterium]|jgi:PAS domain S-box-containing protein|nr:hypothetical protein [Bacteroidota bacterium]
MEDNLLIEKLRELMARDFIHRKSIETELYRSEEKYRLLVDQLGDAIYLSSTDGYFEGFNRAMNELFGYSYQELRQLRVQDIYAREADRTPLIQQLRERGEVRDYEVKLKKKNGEFMDCLITSSLRLDEENRIIGYQGIIRDITLRKKAMSLQQEKDLAERANRFKAEFLANMSHEIRTPLNAINGMVQLMQGTPLNPKQREYMEAISTSGESLLHIINEILDFSKIEAGRMELEKHPFSIRKNVESLIATIRFKAEEKGLDLVLDMADDIPETLLGDGLRLNQILLNLVSNAIKFTAEGEVRVTTRLIDIIGAQARIFFSVKDTGIGIESEHLETIFDSFTQAATDTTRLYGGTGLGLAIVKKLVEILNGAIMVKSKLGEGSEFIFEVEMEVADAQNATEAPEKEGRTLKVKDLEARLLLAEDHPLNQLVTTEMLKGKWPSLEIEVAENGKQAIAMLEDKHYDLVLMDVQMPEMDGHTATRYIRSSMPAPTNELPILAFTAYATSGEAEKCLQAGMNDYVSKPVMAHILQDKIIDLLIAHPGFDNERIIFEKEASNTEQLNLNYLDAITDDDNDLKTRMLGIMLDETPIELKRLEEQAAAANWDGVRATAHKMKSTMQFLGLNDTLDQVKFIELSAREKVNLPEVHERIKKVTEVCNEVMEGIRLEIQRIK